MARNPRSVLHAAGRAVVAVAISLMPTTSLVIATASVGVISTLPQPVQAQTRTVYGWKILTSPVYKRHVVRYEITGTTNIRYRQATFYSIDSLVDFLRRARNNNWNVRSVTHYRR